MYIHIYTYTHIMCTYTNGRVNSEIKDKEKLENSMKETSYL